GQLRPMSDIILQVATHLNTIPDVAKRNTEAIAVMGKSALTVLPDLLELPKAIEGARQAGKFYSDQELESFAKMQKEMALIDQRWDYLTTKLKQGVVIPFMFIAGAFSGEGSVDAAKAGKGIESREDFGFDPTPSLPYMYGASMSRSQRAAALRQQ